MGAGRLNCNETSSTRLRAPIVALSTATQATMGIVMNFGIPYLANRDEMDIEGKVGFVFKGLDASAAF
ncbi:maltose permease [Apiospora sp. TS-2023a]